MVGQPWRRKNKTNMQLKRRPREAAVLPAKLPACHARNASVNQLDALAKCWSCALAAAPQFVSLVSDADIVAIKLACV